MKNKIKIIIMTCLAISVLLGQGCKKEDDCNGKGTLQLRNTSVNTTQNINIDGVNYGLLYPGDSKKYSLPAGTHTFTFQNASGGGNGCSSSTVIIVECETESFSCSG